MNAWSSSGISPFSSQRAASPWAPGGGLWRLPATNNAPGTALTAALNAAVKAPPAATSSGNTPAVTSGPAKSVNQVTDIAPTTGANTAAANTRAKGIDQVSLSDAGLSAARQDILTHRVSDLETNTVNMAQDFLGQVAHTLFGDQGDGAKLSFDSFKLDAQSTFSAAAQQSSGPNGTSSAASVRLEDQAHFSGKGTITTADGHKVSFTIEVDYDASLEMSAATASSASSGAAASPAAVSSLPAKDASAASDGNSTGSAAAVDNKKDPVDLSLDFAGSVADLFRMFTQNLLQSSFAVAAAADSKASANAANAGKQGQFNLRLLDLLDQAGGQPDAKPDPQAALQADTKSGAQSDAASARDKKLAQAYSDQAASIPATVSQAA
jgi:hypothetical protein